MPSQTNTKFSHPQQIITT